MSPPYYLAVDVRSATTTAAIAERGTADAVRVSGASLGTGGTLPTAVYIGPDQLHFGEAALALGAGAPERLIRDFLPADGEAGTTFVVAGEEFSSADLYAWMVDAVTSRVSQERGGAPTGIWVVVPAPWSEMQLRIIAEAFDRDGQSEVDFIGAPEALASRYSQLDPSDSALTVIVCDLDETTLTTSIERISAGGASRPLGDPILAPVLDGGVGSSALDRRAVESVALGMHDSGVDLDDVDAIVLTGVSDRVDEFGRVLADRFGDPIATDPQPALAAALGAALLLEREATAAQLSAPAVRPAIGAPALVATAGARRAQQPPRTVRSWFRRPPGLVALGVGVAALVGGIAVASAFAIGGVAPPPGGGVTPPTSDVTDAEPVDDPGERATPAATATPTAPPEPAPTVPPAIADPVESSAPQTPARPRAVVASPRPPATVVPAPAPPAPPTTSPVPPDDATPAPTEDPVEETPPPVEETPPPVEETPPPVEETPPPVEETPPPTEVQPAPDPSESDPAAP